MLSARMVSKTDNNHRSEVKNEQQKKKKNKVWLKLLSPTKTVAKSSASTIVNLSMIFHFKTINLNRSIYRSCFLLIMFRFLIRFSNVNLQVPVLIILYSDFWWR